MVEKKTAAKKAPAKTKKETVATKPAAPKAKKAAPAKTKKTAEKTIRVTQIGSPISRHPSQRQTLIGLGLNKMHKTRELEDTPAIRGMINKVKHLVRVDENAA